MRIHLAALAMLLAFPFALALEYSDASARDDASVSVPQYEEITDEEAARAQRAALRAFYTAPPVMPHDRSLLRNHDCQYCHSEVREFKSTERLSTKTPHAQMSNCMQCHVAVEAPVGEAAEPVATSWQGLEEPGAGDRAHLLAPPTLPHRLFLRENCLSCHSTESPYVFMRCTHPERSNCLQCHVPGLDNEFRLDRSGLVEHAETKEEN